jgi:hypothetical protein
MHGCLYQRAVGLILVFCSRQAMNKPPNMNKRTNQEPIYEIVVPFFYIWLVQNKI